MTKLQFARNTDNAGPNGQTRFVSILSGKGGVGKSVVAFNLAERISRMGRRVLLVDADLTAGNIHILANAACDRGISDFVSGQGDLAEMVTRIDTHLDILAASKSPDSVINNGSESAGLLQGLQEQGRLYDYILFDHASGISSVATAIAYGSDLNILVLVPELTSISDAYGLLKHLQRVGDNLVCWFLLNRVASEAEATDVCDSFKALTDRFLVGKPEYMGWLPESGLVRQAIASQRAIASIDGDSQIATRYSQLAERLVVRLVEGELTLERKNINKTTATADIWGKH